MASRMIALSALKMASAVSAFVHPGVLINQEQLDFIIAQVGNGAEPFASTLKKARQFTFMTNRMNASGPPANGTIGCGFFDHPDDGCANETSDAQACLIDAYLWMVTKETTWATRAINIMNHYAQNLKEYGNWGNGQLEAAWSADKWARAAEIFSSTGAPWAQGDQDAFKRMLLDVSVPMIWNGSCYNGNWELSMIEGLAGIAVYTENATIWDRAMEMWRLRIPAYFYIASDGPKPNQVPSCRDTSWYDQLVFNASVDGVAQETCRDFGHTSFGIASAFNVAETAYIQGVDLYSEQKERLAAALEFHATFVNEGGNPITKNVTNPFVCNGTVLKLIDAPTYQIGLTGLGRAGYGPAQLPQTAAYVQQVLWNMYYNAGCDAFMMCYEPLTHGAWYANATPA